MRPLYGHDEAVMALVASIIGDMERGFPQGSKAIGVIDKDGNLVGGMVYSDWNPERGIIEMSGASLSKKWLNKKTMTAMFSYPFKTAKCQAAYMNTNPHDAPLHRQLKAIGFEQYILPRLRGRFDAAHLFVLTDDKWNDSKFNGDR